MDHVTYLWLTGAVNQDAVPRRRQRVTKWHANSHHDPAQKLVVMNINSSSIFPFLNTKENIQSEPDHQQE